MEKKVRENDKLYVYNLDKEDGSSSLNIYEFGESGDVKGELYFVEYQDYGFKAYDFDNWEIEEKEFIFTIDDLIYLPLKHMLKGDESLVIEDDFTREDNIRYVEIINGDIITVRFVDKKDDLIDRLSINIKNIMYDGRSKIDQRGLDTKDRIWRFYQELYQEFSKDYHQITIEEHLLKKENG